MLTAAAPKDTTDYSFANPDVKTWYATAGAISTRVLRLVMAELKAGAKTNDVCVLGDKLMAEELEKVEGVKGIAFPTCVNPNNVVNHLAPVDAEDEANVELQVGDVCNVMLGVHVNNFPAVIAETAVVGGGAEGRKADVVSAAWACTEAALRTMRVGAKNFDVTNVVDKVAQQFDTAPVQSMLSHNQERGVLYGPKELIINPIKEHKAQMDTCRFEEGDVFGLDILVTTLETGKVQKSKFKTTLHKLTGSTGSLRLKVSQAALKEFKDKHESAFPVHVREFADPKKARLGLIECGTRSVVLAYEVMEVKATDFVAQFFTTVLITKDGAVRFTEPQFDAAAYKTDKVLDDETKKLLAEPL